MHRWSFIRSLWRISQKRSNRENKIITDLLSLVKMDKKAADLHIENKNINELLELIIKRLTPIADKQDINLVLESFRPVNAEVDETKLTLALSNLVENAIKYNKEGGWVHVSLNIDNKYFLCKSRRFRHWYSKRVTGCYF